MDKYNEFPLNSNAADNIDSLLLLQYLTNDKGENCIYADGRVIEFSNPFIFCLAIFFKDNEIQPALFPTFGLPPIYKVDDGAQEEKTEYKNEGFCPPEQENISP